MNASFLAASCLVLCACAGASAQDTRPAPPDAPRAPRLRLMQPDGGLQPGPRLRGEGPRLGVTVESTADGLKVTGVDADSLAASAGVQAEDVLMRIGEQRVHEVDDVAFALAGRRGGEEVEVTVIRPGQGLLSLKGTLPAPKEPAQQPGPDGLRGGFLGVQMQADAERGDCGGVAVAGVVPDSAAWFAGLEAGDCLLALDGKPLAGSEDLAGAVAGKEPGTLVELRWSRAGAEQVAKVRLGHRGPVDFLGGFGAPGQGFDAPGLRTFRLPRGQGLWLAPDGQDQDAQTPFHDFDFGDLHDMLLDLRDLPGQMHGLQVRIDGDRMTVTRDGVSETYTRDADGNWIKDAATPPAPEGA